MSRPDDDTGRRRPWARWDPVLPAALGVALVLRVLWCAYAARTPTSFGDPFSYLYLADDLANGKGYVTFYVGAPTAYYPVGYPAVLGGLLWAARLVASGTTPLQVAIALNLVCGTATVAVVYSLARRLGTRRSARIAAVLVAVFPNLIIYTATAYLETVFCFLVALIAWILVGPRAPDRAVADELAASGPAPPPATTRTAATAPRRPGLAVPRPGMLVLLGAVFATATMIRPITLAFLPVLLLAWGFGRPGWLRAVGGVAVVAALVAVVAVPWSIRSSRALGGLVIISTNTGDNLCIGHAPESTGAYLDLNEQCGHGYDDVPADRVEVERNRRGTERALTYARQHPLREIKLLGLKTWYLFEHDHEGVDAVESYGADAFLPDALRTALKLVSDAFYYLIGALALVGAAWVAVRGDGRSRLVLGWTATLLLVPLVFFGGPRFHVPALPFVAVFASLAIDRLLARRTRQRAGPAAVPGV